MGKKSSDGGAVHLAPQREKKEPKGAGQREGGAVRGEGAGKAIVVRHDKHS